MKRLRTGADIDLIAREVYGGFGPLEWAAVAFLVLMITVEAFGLRAQASPHRPAHMPVLVDFWRADTDPYRRSQEQAWQMLLDGYSGRTDVTAGSTTIIEPMANGLQRTFTRSSDGREIDEYVGPMP